MIEGIIPENPIALIGIACIIIIGVIIVTLMYLSIRRNRSGKQ